MPRDTATRTAPRSADPRLRAALLMPLAALAVHQGRYYVAFGAHTPARLLRDGHAYLGSVIPFAVLAAALALGLLAGRLARSWQTAAPGPAGPPARRRHAVRIWGVCTVLLLCLYCGQELIEGALAAGHAGGLAAITGTWLALPLAIVIGGVLALVLRAEAALVRFLAALRSRRRAATPELAIPARTAARSDWRLTASYGVGAGRAPPPALGHR